MNHTFFLQIFTGYMAKLLLGVGAIIASILVGIFLFQAHAAPQNDGRLITIHDRGQDKVIISKAETVSDALKSAHIATLPDDTVDPDLDVKLTSNAYQINVYRAQPVLIVDGNMRAVVMSPHQTPKQIAEKAGLTLYDEDNAQLVRTSDLLQSDGAGLELSIDRATQFNLVFYGKQIDARTQELTVADMLQAKHITLGKNDALSVAADTKITPGIKVEVWRNGKQTISEEQPVAFAIQQTQDTAQPVGYKLVKTPGVLGKKVVTYEVDMRNGKEIARREIQSVQTLAPLPQSEVVGSKPSFSGDFAAALAKLRSCEGGYNSWNPAGYYGAYQFDRQTWGTVASPSTFQNATPAEQDAAAHQLYLRRGWHPWPNCGRNLPDTYR